LLVAFSSGGAYAQQVGTSRATSASQYPVKPVRLVVGLAPGGATDIIARQIAQKLTETLGQQVIVDNRSGAAGSLAASIVAKSPIDGYTLLVVSSSFAINPSLQELTFDSVKDFQSVGRIAQAPFILVVNPGLRTESVKELVALAKAKPGTLLFSSGGTGGSGHLAGELFKYMTNITVEHVPYRGGAPALLDVVSGQVQFTFSAITAGLQQTRNGRVRALGVTSIKRSKAAADIPTIAEAGVAGYQVVTWYAVLAPAGIRSDIVNRLNQEIAKIVRMPDVAEKLLSDGAEPASDTPAEFGRFLSEEVMRFKKLARDIGLKAEKISLR
jgi:tripartite-type tricarboxylate transporter receptor subunit TctC